MNICGLIIYFIIKVTNGEVSISPYICIDSKPKCGFEDFVDYDLLFKESKQDELFAHVFAEKNASNIHKFFQYYRVAITFLDETDNIKKFIPSLNFNNENLKYNFVKNMSISYNFSFAEIAPKNKRKVSQLYIKNKIGFS